MTDYLEELLDNTEALLEQVRRLERSGSGPALEEAEGEVSSSAFHSAQGSVKERALAGDVKTEESLQTVELRKARARSVPDAGSGSGIEDGALEPPKQIPTPLEEKEPPEQISMPLEETEPLERISTPLKEKARPKEGSILLEQLERLERAAAFEFGDSAANRSTAWGEDSGWRRTAFSISPAGVRREAVYSSVTGAAGDSWTLGAGFSGTDAQAAEELRWAEQADRAFRRDSRRYDGGFYLY